MCVLRRRRVRIRLLRFIVPRGVSYYVFLILYASCVCVVFVCAYGSFRMLLCCMFRVRSRVSYYASCSYYSYYDVYDQSSYY